MKEVRLYQSSKYNSSKYRVAHYIYYYDKTRNRYCLPLTGLLDNEENMEKIQIILKLLCDKYEVYYDYLEIIQVGDKKFTLFELNGRLDALMKVSDLIGKSIMAVYYNEVALDLLIN